MKRTFTFFTLFLLLLQISASAQGEWKWANYWSGSGGDSGDSYYKIIRTAFDEEENIYVFGQIGGNLEVNGLTLPFTNPQVLSSNKRGAILAKFDTLGNMLWYKLVKSSEAWDCFPYWMEVKDGKVYISGDISLDYVDNPLTMNNVWLYYLDTLITGSQVHAIPVEQRRPPYKTGRSTYFATLDLNGNLLENHFVESFSREIHNGFRGEKGLCYPGLGYAPFYVNRNGNTFVYTKLQYGGRAIDPYTIMVDGDTNKKYDLYFPEDVEPYYYLNTGMMYIFSPDWELLQGKPMVDHTEGIATSWELAHDSVNPLYTLYINGLSFDEEDNMYISGYINLALQLNHEFGGDLHKYPARIYWDSTNFCTFLDITSSAHMPFLIKYDTGGDVLWCNQIYTQGDNSQSASAGWTGSSVNAGSVFVLGNGAYNESENGLVYFDNENNPLQRFQQNSLYQTFFVRYDAQTGQYLNHGIVPEQHVACGEIPSSINNRVFAYAHGYIDSKDIICEWKNDGAFIQEINFNSSGVCKYSSVQCNAQGNLIFTTTVNAPITFGNNVSASCPYGSSAVLALYSDPSFAEPLPEDSTGIAEHSVKVDVRLWPNPATDKITIESEDTFPIKSVCIADMQGTIVGILPVDDTHCTLNVGNLSAGTYIAHVETKAGISDCKFVVKK